MSIFGKRSPGLYIYCLAFLLLPGVIRAQSSTASLRGVITDGNGAVVAGVEIVLANVATGFHRTAATDAEGSYRFIQIPPATYEVTIHASGFNLMRITNVQLLVDTPVTLDRVLQPQTLVDTIEVSAVAPLINSEDASLGHSFDTRQIDALPFEGRDPVGILSLQPGVAFIGNGEGIDPNEDSRNGSVNGARSDQTNVTIDGVDNNDQLSGYAFQGALRATLDSLQEFRVTTSNANADAGRSSGAQVMLITKSGTNSFHGSLYEFHRPTFTTANDWFNKHAQLTSGEPNVAGKVIRNTFGAAVGGPIVKDRLYFFATYEGQRTRENTQITRTVPSEDLRAGIIHYTTCPTAPNCTPGDPANTIATLTPAQIATMDPNCTAIGSCPAGPGVNQAVLSVFQSYPLPNTDQVGDGLNFRGYTFSGSAPAKLDTYIAKLDYNLGKNGNQRLFLRGNLQNDRISGKGQNGPEFPGAPSNEIDNNNSKGIAVGYSAVISSKVINNLRYGFVRQGIGRSGLSDQHHVSFLNLSDPTGFSRSSSAIVPVHNWLDDVAWTAGSHTVQFGGALRLINNIRESTERSFFGARTNPSFFATGGIANKGSSFDPAAFGFSPVASFGEDSYDAPLTAIAGLIPQVNGLYNRTKTGDVLPEGTAVARHFRAFEAEWYVQDSWKLKPSLVVTAGARYSLLQPPYEANGIQVAPSIRLSDFFNNRQKAMQAGQTYRPDVSYDLAGQANGRRPYWDWNYKNIAPRISFAWSPSMEHGWIKSLFGGSGKTSIRGGYGIYYDHFGQGIVNTLDRHGSFGLTTSQITPVGTVNVDTAPRFTGLSDIPTSSVTGAQLLIPPPAAGFPSTPPNNFDDGGFAITWGLDDKLKTPYSHAMDLSITRELPKGFVLEVAYVGRLGRHLLQEEDLAMPLNIRDPLSGADYFSAASQFAVLAEKGTPIGNIPQIPYWENIFPTAAGPGLLSGNGAGTKPCSPGPAPSNPTATQNMYDTFFCNLHNETAALFVADVFCFPACATLGGATSKYQFFDGQWSSLFAWRSIGTSSYHGGQFTLRRAMKNGLQFDFNYTLSNSIDTGSNAERVSTFEGSGFSSQIINSWDPKQLRSVSDFDARHQINANWVYELPFGEGRRWAMGSRVLNAIIGGWQFSGLFRWTSAFPYTVINGGPDFPTNWELEGQGVLIGKAPKTGVFTDGNGDPNVFKDPTAALASFRFPRPGESGTRNAIRGAGFFGIDSGLSKTWRIKETQTLRFSWETFNATNSVRFGVSAGFTGAGNLGEPQTLGKYNQTLTRPRVMQFALRYSF